jgi:mono/diheme cytochrome c family protein
MAPRVEGAVEEMGKDMGYPARSLNRGRRIYLTKCAKCHGVEPIDRYSVEEWGQILPEMATETNLDADELADLRAYILTAHRSMEEIHRMGNARDE